MATSVTVPRLGWSMEEGTFVEWLKADGDAVRPGDPLFTLESDKSTETIEAIDAGVLRIPSDGPRSGQKVRVGQVIAYLAGAGEELPAATAPVVAGPAVRKLARSLGVDLGRVVGSGPGGRIREEDLRPAESSAPVATKADDAPRRRRPVTPRAAGWRNNSVSTWRA
ncbi:MAG: E3 binding domain-containing protein [Gemmataceae bacterium]